jgi:CRP-like cAMP-binding protein
MAAKLKRQGQLTDAQANALKALPYRREQVEAPRTLIREGAEVTNCCVLVSGFAGRSKLNRNGDRQFVSFQVPGDILDIQHILLPTADHTLQMVKAGSVAFVAREHLREMMRADEAIADAIWRDCLIEASIFREWVLNVGRRDAVTRIAHMLCEFFTRYQNAGLGDPKGVILPFTQEMMADATGLTTVHINRMIRRLREAGAVSGRARDLRVSNFETMKEIAQFNPAYLHLTACA